MAKNRKEPKIKLKRPDKSGPDPSQQTLFDIAQQRGLLEDEVLIGRVGESILWSMSLTMVHFTFDVLVASQYAVDIEWLTLAKRTLQAFPGMQSLSLVLALSFPGSRSAF